MKRVRTTCALVSGTLVMFTMCLSWTPLQAAEPDTTTRPLRLGIAPFVRDPEATLRREESERLIDLLTSQLSNAPGLELVERAALDKILSETALTLSTRATPAQAIRVGQLLKADWLILGTVQNYRGTNFVLAKIVDAHTGLIRDLTGLAVDHSNLLACAETLARFTRRARAATNDLSQRIVLAFGAFTDLGLNHRYSRFSQWLRSFLTRYFAPQPAYSVVERFQVEPLLQEWRLGLHGLAADTSLTSRAQPAFVIVDGVYQSFRAEQTRLNLVLRLEALGGRMQSVALNELPDLAFPGKVAQAIEQALQDRRALGGPPAPADEVKAQLARARQLTPSRLPPVERYRHERVPRLNDAIAAYQSVLLLDPQCDEARMKLAACLADRHLQRLEDARQCWREAIVLSTNAETLQVARRALAQSYAKTDPFQAAELLSALCAQARDLAERVKLNGVLRRIYYRLGRDGQLDGEFLKQFMTEAWRAECRLASIGAEHGGRIDTFNLVKVPASDYKPAFLNHPRAMREYVSHVVTNLTREFPLLLPYLVSGYLHWAGTNTPAYWREWHRRVLDECLQAPDQVLAPASFYRAVLWHDFTWLVYREENDFALRLGTFLQQHGRQYLRGEEPATFDLYLGVVYYRRHQWREALTAFERVGDRRLSTDLKGPWGNTRFASARIAAEQCRKQIALEAAKARGDAKTPAQLQQQLAPPPVIPPPAPVTVLLAKGPVYSAGQGRLWTGQELKFAVQGSRVWIKDKEALSLYDTVTGELRRVPGLPPGTVATMTIARNRLWIGTRNNGLIAVDTDTLAPTHYTVAEGLLMPEVSALLPTRDRLWIGFAGAQYGGTAYLDFEKNRIVGIMGELPRDIFDGQPGERLRTRLLQRLKVSRCPIADFAQSPDGRLWTLSCGQVMQYVGTKPDPWKHFPIGHSGLIPQIAANNQFLVLPCRVPTGWSSGMKNFGGLLIYDRKRAQCRQLTSADGFPNDHLCSVDLDGNKAWVGGRRFVALVDLPTARVEKVCRMHARFSIHCLKLAGNHVWFTSGPGLYRLPKDGSVDPTLVNAPEQPAEPVLPVNGDPETLLPEAARLARALNKKRVWLARLYGTSEAEPIKTLNARFEAVIRRVASAFPVVTPPAPTATNRFFKLILNQRGAGLDGFRFHNDSAAPGKFAWVFAFERPYSMQHWYIVPAEPQDMVGFTSSFPPNLIYTNVPWSNISGACFEQSQWLRQASILPDKEYIIWFLFKDDQPNVLHFTFGLFPAAVEKINCTVIDESFGLKGKPRPIY